MGLLEEMSRRGFINSITGIFAAAAARLRRAPKPVSCVACGSVSHSAPCCPINNAAMGRTMELLAPTPLGIDVMGGVKAAYGGGRGGKTARAKEVLACLESQGYKVVRLKRA